VDGFIRFDCPACGKPIKSREALAGKQATCPNRTCGRVVRVPAPRVSVPRVPVPQRGLLGIGLLVAGGIACFMILMGGIGVWLLIRGTGPQAGSSPSADDSIALVSTPADTRTAEEPPTPPVNAKSPEKAPGKPVVVESDDTPRKRTASGVPELSDLRVTSTSTSPMSVAFSLTIRPGKAPVSFNKKSGLWYCVGKPSTIPSMRLYLEGEVRRLKPSLDDPNNVVMMGSMNGPGLVAGPCDKIQSATDNSGTWTGVVRPGLTLDGDQVEIGNRFGSATFTANELPVSFLLWDDDYKVSNELKAIIDLKAGKLVRLEGDATKEKDKPNGTGKVFESRRFEAPSGSEATFTADGQRVVSVSQELELFEWDVATGKQLRHLPARDKQRLLAVSADGRTALSAYRPMPKLLGQLQLWDLASGKEVKSWLEPDGTWDAYGPKAAFAPDGASVATLYEEPSIRTLPNGNIQFGGDRRKEVFLWDCQTGRAIPPMPVRADGAIAFSPDGQWLVADNADKNVVIRDLKSGKELRTLTGTPGSPVRLLVSADSKFVVATCINGEKYALMIWNAATGAKLHQFDSLRTFVRGMAFAPDGRTLLGAERGDSEKGIPPSFHLWDMATGRLVGSHEAKGVTDIYAVAFSPDGESLVTVGNNGKQGVVQIWSSLK